MMEYGKPTAAQCLAIQPFVKGRSVRDLGCGEMHMSKLLIDLGARRVTAIDCQQFKVPKGYEKYITFQKEEFIATRYSSSVVLVSWPCNYKNELHRLLPNARIVIYLGKNYDATGCGYDDFWLHLVQRKVLAYAQDRQNTLIVYGGLCRSNGERKLLVEEKAALRRDRIYAYEDLLEGRVKLTKQLRDKLPGTVAVR